MDMISDKQVQRLLPISRAIEVVEQAFKDYCAGTIRMGSRGFLDVNSKTDSCIFLPAVQIRERYFSMKYAASFPSCHEKGLPTVQSVIWLFSVDTGNACAMIEANALTALKTGAASGVATRFLANENAGILTIIGAGEQAKFQLEAISLVRDLTHVRLVDVKPDQSETLKKWAQNYLKLKIPITIFHSADQAIKGSDLIVTCTTSKHPVFNGHNLTPGVHINAMGSFTPEMQEIDAQTILKSDKIVTDNVSEVWKFAGDLLIPLESGVIPRTTAIYTLGEIVEEKSKGRRAETEITLYESVGFASLDLAVAIEVYKRFKSASH